MRANEFTKLYSHIVTAVWILRSCLWMSNVDVKFHIPRQVTYREVQNGIVDMYMDM